MPDWVPMFLLPNIEVRKAIEADGLALVSLHDPRLQALAEKHLKFADYLNRFTTEFGQQIQPSVIIWRNDSPENYHNVEALGAFRDVVAMSVIPQSWTRAMRYDKPGNVRYSDYFTFYPWMIDKNYDRVVTQTINMIGLHEIRQLRGQSSPGLSPTVLDDEPIDEPLLKALLLRWENAFKTDKRSTEDTQLFRSLGMANAAAQLPGGAGVTKHDIGRSIALWSSAFEILTPAKNQSYLQVYALLDKITWNFEPCKELKYEAYGFNNDKQPRNLPSWIFGAINQVRNDFLHGNPINDDHLIVPPAKRPLNLYVAPLYRMALAAFIDLKHVPHQRLDGETEYEAYRRDQHRFGRYQGDIEVVLSSVMMTKEQFRARGASPTPRIRPTS